MDKGLSGQCFKTLSEVSCRLYLISLCLHYKNLSLRQAYPLPHCTDLFLLDIFSIRTYF